MIPTVRAGDKVRITFEETVRGAHKGGAFTTYSLYVDPAPVRGRTVEVIERAKPKVGDVLHSTKDYGMVPIGTVVSTTFSSTARWVKVDGDRWLDLTCPKYSVRSPDFADGDRTILYIPEG